jgi:hypothetical protein
MWRRPRIGVVVQAPAKLRTQEFSRKRVVAQLPLLRYRRIGRRPPQDGQYATIAAKAIGLLRVKEPLARLSEKAPKGEEVRNTLEYLSQLSCVCSDIS